MDDVLILGGGVIGLSLAYELAGRGAKVRVIDRGRAGGEASWAGAGILPSARYHAGDPPAEQLAGLSAQLHETWAEELREATGIDTGLRRTGGLHIARREGETAALRFAAGEWRAGDIAAEEISPNDIPQFEPAMRDASTAVGAAYFLPGERQIRNPRHLKALAAACAQRGVVIEEGVAAEDISAAGERVTGVLTSAGTFTAGDYCLCSGAWSRSLAQRMGVSLRLKPIRGQIALLSAAPGLLRHILHEESRYVVPRPDGRILIGSTEEDVGFRKQTTSAGISGLLDFALSLAPGLAQAAVERCWAGLRPCTADGLPYLGVVPGLNNAYLAAGHFRSGLQLSPATAVVMADLILGQPSSIDLGAFALDRA